MKNQGLCRLDDIPYSLSLFENHHDLPKNGWILFKDLDYSLIYLNMVWMVRITY